MGWLQRLLGKDPGDMPAGPVPATDGTAELIAGYAARFDSAVTAAGHSVSSPLGAWLLLALAGSAAAPDGRSAIEDWLGTDADDALRRASALLAEAPAVVSAAAAVWARHRYLAPDVAPWLSRLPGPVEQGDVPDQAGADEWARQHTDGLIDRFPVSLDPLTALVLASALVTKVTWVEPFGLAPSRDLGGAWASAVEKVLWAPPAHERFVAGSSAGDVAVHASRSVDGLLVVSVIAAPEVEPGKVLAAANETAVALVCRPAAVAHRSLFDLPLGDGHSWTVTERVVPRPAGGPDRDEQVRSLVLPAWSASSDHELLSAEVGFAEAAAILTNLADPAFAPFTFDARQVAVASYSRLGFEAAAVTAMAMRAASLAPELREVTVRQIDIRFARPYAVVAVVESAESPTWVGVPVFSAWVTHPDEPHDT